MTISESGGSLIWAHLGDLHISAESEPNYRDFQLIVESISQHLPGQIDFCVLPGDNADDGSADQYDWIRRVLKRLQIPVHVIPGDHDRKPGDLKAFYHGLKIESLPNATPLPGTRYAVFGPS
jgi:3',5'-cyclic-AMP phosphodiesterase